MQINNTKESDLDYVLEAEGNEENRKYIIPWSPEKHFRALSDHNSAHLILQDEVNVGYVILAGLLDPNQNIEFRRIVITEKGKGYGKAAVEIIKQLAFETMPV